MLLFMYTTKKKAEYYTKKKKIFYTKRHIFFYFRSTIIKENGMQTLYASKKLRIESSCKKKKKGGK